jgi:hypothetical protein
MKNAADLRRRFCFRPTFAERLVTLSRRVCNDANPSPDGDSYGSRRSRAKRETAGNVSAMEIDPGWGRG